MAVQSSAELIRDFADKAGRYGTRVVLVSTESDEGKVLLAAFGGLGAILRFAV